MTIKALIPVRAGSERVQNKNTRLFCETTLLNIKIRQLKNLEEQGFLDGVVVNSEDSVMLQVAEDLECEIEKRDGNYSLSYTPMSDVYYHMAKNFDADVMVYCNVTNPLIEDHVIKDCIQIYKNLPSYMDSVNTAHLIKEFLIEDGKAFNYDMKNQPRSQDLPDIYALNFAVNVISRKSVLSGKNIVGSDPFLYQLDEIQSIDIDTEVDFEIAEYFYKSLKSLRE